MNENSVVVKDHDDETWRRRRRRRRRRGQQQGQQDENVFNNNNNGGEESSSATAENLEASSSQYEEKEETDHNSHILRINADTRLAHLAAILPLSSWNSESTTGQRELVDFRVYLQISVYLAWHHLKYRNLNHVVLPDVSARLQDCDLQFTLQLHDSQFSPIHAARQLVQVLLQTKAQVASSTTSTTTTTRSTTRRRAAVAEDVEISNIPEKEQDHDYDNNNKTIQTYYAQKIYSLLPPMAIMGAARSAVTATLNDLSSVYGIPQISGSSTASILDDKTRHPLLARTVPTNVGDARAIILYLQHLSSSSLSTSATATATAGVNIQQHLVVLYIGDDFGTNYHAAVVREASLQHVSIRSIQYTTEQSMESALLQLKESGIRYVLAILNPQSWKQLLAQAVSLDIAGPDTGYTWFLTEANLEVANPEFVLDIQNNVQDALVAQALHGTGIVLIHIPNHARMDQALQDFRNNVILQQDFVSRQYDDEAKQLLLQNFTYPPVGQSFYQYLYYDAIMALGIAACETKSRDLFTGPELYQQLLKTEFQGVSGTVSFDPMTGTRRAQNFVFRIVNLIRKDENENDNDGMVRFQTQIAALVHPPNDSSNISTTTTGMGSTNSSSSNNNNNNNNEIVELLAPFVYADSTTDIPVDLNPLVQDLNLITPAFRGIGLTLGLLAMFSSIGWMIWTLCHRKMDVVKSSQPFFLVQLCIGTLVMSSAIIPLSFQEPISDRVLDMSCMTVPWLISLGFVTAFSALFSKTSRLRRLYAAGRRCRRVTLEPKDVMLPFIVLLTINLILLVAWSIVAPLTWERVPLDNFDTHGRAVESVGSCRATYDEVETQKVLPFAVLILAVNVVALLYATYQAYLAREIPTEFFEAGYVFMSFASLLETFIIGIPLMFIGSTDPNASFLIRSILITICCLAIQLPVFVPKYNKRKTVLEERQYGSSENHSNVNVFIDGRQVNISSLSRSGLQEGSSSGIRRPWRKLFGTPGRDEQSTTEASAISSATSTPSAAQMGKSLVRRTPKYYKREELKRRRREYSPSPSSVGATGGLGLKPASLGTLFESRDQQQQQLSKSQSDRSRPISAPSRVMQAQDSKQSVTSKASEVEW